MNSRTPFSLNTSPVESDGGSPTDTIDESFWQVHLWPSSNAFVDVQPQLPENIFGRESISCGNRGIAMNENRLVRPENIFGRGSISNGNNGMTMNENIATPSPVPGPCLNGGSDGLAFQNIFGRGSTSNVNNDMTVNENIATPSPVPGPCLNGGGDGLAFQNIFGRGSISNGNKDMAMNENIANPSPVVPGSCLNDGGGLAFRVLDGEGGSVPVKVDDRPNVGKKRRSSNEEINLTLTDHVNGERERRKKMRSMFTTLHNLLPHLSDKVDKSTIVNEAINLIKTLETTLQNLQQKASKLRRVPTTATATYEPPPSTSPQLKLAGKTTRESFLADYGSGLTPNPRAHQTVENGPTFHTWTSSNVVLNTFGMNEALIMACSRKKPGLLAAMVAVLVKHKVEVENLHVLPNGDHCSYMIHARLMANDVSEQYPNPSAEEVYKQAASELMILVADDAMNAGA